MHPKYFGKILSPEQRLKAEDLLSTMYPEMIPTYLSVLAQTDPFPELRFREEDFDKYLQQFGGKVYLEVKFLSIL